jgi:hypothetical protein
MYNDKKNIYMNDGINDLNRKGIKVKEGFRSESEEWLGF